MYIVTGGAGFIGSAAVWRLNQAGIDDVLIVDNLGRGEKWRNLVKLKYRDYLAKDEFVAEVARGRDFGAKAVVHMGACSSTTEPDASYLMRNNFLYTKTLCEYCLAREIRFINASSAATYGDGSKGFRDDEAKMEELRPLNMYGYTKQLFDLWAWRKGALGQLASLKFFNVFGPNENHKAEMRSVVHKAFGQIKESGRLRLFKSDRQEYPDGGQMRDFVYVKDCVELIWWLLENPRVAGVFNVGAGVARTWNDLAKAVFAALKLEPNIEYVDMPPELKGKYQYYTLADISKLRGSGFEREMTSLELAVKDYLQNYLLAGDPYLG